MAPNAKISSSTDVVILIMGGLITSTLFALILFFCGAMIISPLAEIEKFFTDCCSNSITWTLLGGLVIILFTTFVILFVISTLIQKSNEKISLLTRCKCFSLIGYGGIALCGIAPRILVYFFVGNDFYINWYIAFISFVATLLIYFIILLPNSKHYKVDYDLDGTWSCIWKHALAHIIVFIVQIRIAVALFENEKLRENIILCQFEYTCICVPSIFDFCQVLRGGVKLRDTPVNTTSSTNGANQNQARVASTNTIVQVDEVPESNVKVECKFCSKNFQNPGFVDENEEAAEIPEHNFKVDCKICMLEYNETRIPRYLRECGHTVCEGCANELLKKNNQGYLCCPFCQEVTTVKGPANLLAKNYALLKVAEKMKSENKF